MWIEVADKNLLVNLDTGVRIELAEPSVVCPFYSLTVHMVSLAHFKDKKDALEALDGLRRAVCPTAKLYLAGTVEMPDPFTILGMRSPLTLTKAPAPDAPQADWMSVAKGLGVFPEEPKT